MIELRAPGKFLSLSLSWGHTAAVLRLTCAQDWFLPVGQSQIVSAQQLFPGMPSGERIQ